MRSMENIQEGAQFQHKHLKNLTCEIISTTSKGYKVIQREGKKQKQASYYSIDFDMEKGFWLPINQL